MTWLRAFRTAAAANARLPARVLARPAAVLLTRLARKPANKNLRFSRGAQSGPAIFVLYRILAVHWSQSVF
ncbi:hypothetical protein EVA_04836 [gut metagenome]|uniref:Uncharacterized protein n=1 Tax=gut metagenome TaxID=749906 RepID=J9GIS4_9ZZZZ